MKGMGIPAWQGAGPSTSAVGLHSRMRDAPDWTITPQPVDRTPAGASILSVQLILSDNRRLPCGDGRVGLSLRARQYLDLKYVFVFSEDAPGAIRKN